MFIKPVRRQLFILLLLLTFIKLELYSQAQLYTQQEVIEDIQYLQENIEKYHPNLYLYSKPEAIDSFFNTLIANIPETVEITEAYQLISSVSQIIKDGHTYIQTSEEQINQFYTHGSIFPLQVYCEGQEMYLLRSFTKDQLLEQGTKLLSINGISSSDIISQIRNSLSRDGHTLSYPDWILNNFFTAYYSFLYGYAKVYEIAFEDEQGNKRIAHLEGLPHTKIQEIRKKEYPIYNQQLQTLNNGITLNINAQANLASIGIKSFNTSRLRKAHQQNFKQTIKDYFTKIDSLGISHLIIDLRGNQGGSLVYGKYLLKHLMDKPFQMVEGYAKVDKHNYLNPTNRVKKVKGPGRGIGRNFKTAFKGQLFVFVDGGSFSCSAMVANVLDKHQRVVLIGEETGGSAFTNTGGPYKQITCPNTKIQCTIPKLQYILQDVPDSNKTGIIPDVFIKNSLDHLIQNTDAFEAYVLKLINE